VETKTVELRDLRERLDEYLKEVRIGLTLVIVDDSKPVARLLYAWPSDVPVEERMHQLADAGVISWSGRKFNPDIPTVTVRGPKTLAELLVEDRDRDDPL